jgi:hypothetical protein
MEQLRAELSLLGEKLSRVECVSEKADTALWSLYDSQETHAADGAVSPRRAWPGSWHGKSDAGAQRYRAYAGRLRRDDPKNIGPMCCCLSVYAACRLKRRPNAGTLGTAERPDRRGAAGLASSG